MVQNIHDSWILARDDPDGIYEQPETTYGPIIAWGLIILCIIAFALFIAHLTPG